MHRATSVPRLCIPCVERAKAGCAKCGVPLIKNVADMTRCAAACLSHYEIEAASRTFYTAITLVIPDGWRFSTRFLAMWMFLDKTGFTTDEGVKMSHGRDLRMSAWVMRECTCAAAS